MTPADCWIARPDPHAFCDQYDSNGDGYGNRCDADLNNDGAVNFADLAILKANFFTAYPDADFNYDHAVNFADLAILKSMFFEGPGPSGETDSISPERIYYIHNDHLGTPKALTDEGGTKVWSATHTPFGQATVNEDPDGDGRVVVFNLRFPGQYYDNETGLHYNYYRYYDPGTGRYMTSDPIGLEGGFNTHLYTYANPLRFIDPTGEAALCPPGHRGVPAPGYESQYPKFFKCEPYPSNPPSEPFPQEDRCMADCMLKNAAMCLVFSAGGTGIGMTIGGIAGSVQNFSHF